MDGVTPSSRRRRDEGHGESKSHKKKRKERNGDVVEGVRQRSKSARFDESGGEKGERSPWKNLQLVMSLQDKNIDVMKNIDLALDYVKSSSNEETDKISLRSQVLDSLRTTAFLNNWIQSVLISSEKKMRQCGESPQFETLGSILDLRCWKIFYFCLEESKNRHISLTCSRDFLRVINLIAKDASSCLNNMSTSVEETPSEDRLQIYDIVLDCVSMVFSFHGGVANENLELWILLMDKMLGSAIEVVMGQLDGSKLGNFILHLACYLFEPFAKFLSVHPTRKSGFQNFIDKLLEPLLQLLHVLHSKPCDSNKDWEINLPKWVEEVLAQGLFHPTHSDGFLSLQSSVRYKNSSDAPRKDEKLVNKSYHRHLFDKVEKIIANKNELALIGLGKLPHLLVSCLMKQKGISVGGGNPKGSDFSSTSHVSSTPSQSQILASNMAPASQSMDAELRKSVFDFYIQIMEYLLSDIDRSFQSDGKVASVLCNVSNTLRSINSLLISLICDKLYLRTEDTSEGASQNFLRYIHDVLMSLSAKIESSPFGSDKNPNREVLLSVRTELIVGFHHLLNIEYEVIGDDLESLWTMVFSSAACCYGSVDMPGQSLLSSEILGLGCRLIDVYSDLRQVDSAIFSLCRAVRHSSLRAGYSEAYSPSGLFPSYTDSLSVLFCSSKFKLSLSNAIKAIPEGQGSACLQQLCSDIKESLEWMKFGDQLSGSGEIGESNSHSRDSPHGHLRAELMGKVLCEAYVIILDSITVTSGNSCAIGASLKSFIEIIRQSLGRVITLQSDGSIKFSVFLDGGIMSKSIGPDNMTLCWILVLFLRLILSCGSLFWQVISLMPPDASKKMSPVVGDSSTLLCGRDWLEMGGSSSEGFFSWIIPPSVALLDVIHSVSDICIQDSVVICPPLVYTLNTIALQRLADLNRLMKSSEYMLQWNQTMESSNQKKIRKWTKCVTKMRIEAAGLAGIMMDCLPFIANDKKSSSDDEIGDPLIHGLHDSNTSNISVGFLNDKSLTSALWGIVCKNVDIWCSHANKKQLKNFLTLTIQESVFCLDNYDCRFQEHDGSTTGCLKTGTVQQIAMEFLSNIISYEQKFVRRYMASRFCRILQKSVLSIFSTSEVDLSESPDWLEETAALDNVSDMQTGISSWTKQNMVLAEPSNKQLNAEFARCQLLLHLLMQMPEEYLSSKSSSLYITYILNFERLIVRGLLDGHDTAPSLNPYQIFQLLVTCRRTFQILAVASDKFDLIGTQSSPCLFPLPWLLKSLSVAIGFQQAFPKNVAFDARAALFSLLDHTSNVLLTVTRNQYKHAISSLILAKENADPGNEEAVQSGSNLHSYSKEALGACLGLFKLAKTLEDNLHKSLTTVREASVDKKIECVAGSQDLNELSSNIACFQGLLWGVASSLGDKTAVHSNSSMKFSSYNTELMTRIRSCVDAYMDIATILMKALFVEDNSTLDSPMYGDGLTARTSSDQYGGPRDGPNVGSSTGEVVPSNIDDNLTKCKPKRKSSLALPNLEEFLTEVQHWKLHLKKSLLIQVFRGENAEVAFLLRQLFIACSAILRLNLRIEFTSLSWSLFSLVIGISEFMLLEFFRSELPNQFTFSWLDGAVRFLDELGNYFTHFDPSLSKDFYVKLIVLHQMAIGKCICLQGREAKLASQDRGSLTKLAGPVQSQYFWQRSRMAEMKERLRMSFITYIRKSSEFHLLSVIQSVERALVGVREGLITNYEIVHGSLNGGEVSSIVAAGIDCLDSILEFVTGPRRLNMIKKHIRSLVACLFNIILHLQGSRIFCAHIDSYEEPDSGSVTLMCMEILTKISGKPSLFEIDACHIAQFLRVPGALFQDFLRLLTSKSPATVDRNISIELYDACCRMLCTALKHHKSETHRCIVLLQDSVSVLLHCLETVNTDHVSGQEFFAWETQEAVICAGSLRRIYEEVRQQKDEFGQFAFQFLSRYIWVYCGLGPSKNGIKREVDEALKPGVYALIDSCSADDLQLLHTVFGEGPCRSTLAALQHDYKVNFQFEGKV